MNTHTITGVITPNFKRFKSLKETQGWDNNRFLTELLGTWQDITKVKAHNKKFRQEINQAKIERLRVDDNKLTEWVRT